MPPSRRMPGPAVDAGTAHHRLETGPSGAGRPAAKTVDRPVLVEARAGDHPLIQRLLLNVFQAPTAAAFQAQLENPWYEPSDRLVIKHGELVVAHARLAPREMEFGDQRLRVALLYEVATLPEYRGRGYATALVAAAEGRMQADGAELGVLQARAPEFYRRHGWVPWNCTCQSRARPREILAQLSALQQHSERTAEMLLGRERPPLLQIGPWRQVQLAALVRLHERWSTGTYGPMVRGEEYWRWLTNQAPHDPIYLAVAPRDRATDEPPAADVVGYAATWRGQIAEVGCDDDAPATARALLSRACRDAIERDLHEIRFHGPPHHPLHAILQAAGGTFRHSARDGSRVWMARLFDLPAFVRRLGPQLAARAAAAGCGPNVELGLRIDGAAQRLTVHSNAAHLAPGRIGRGHLECSRETLSQLLLGHWHVAEALEQRVLIATTAATRALAETLFPRLPVWHSPLDR